MLECLRVTSNGIAKVNTEEFHLLVDRRTNENPDTVNPIQKPLQLFKQGTRALSNLNTEMSLTLRDSIGHLDDICLRVRNCLEDIRKNETEYNLLKEKIARADNSEELNCILPAKFHEIDSCLTISLAECESKLPVKSDMSENINESCEIKKSLQKIESKFNQRIGKKKNVNKRNTKKTIKKMLPKNESSGTSSRGQIKNARKTTEKQKVPSSSSKNSLAKTEKKPAKVPKLTKNEILALMQSRSMTQNEKSLIIGKLKTHIRVLRAKNECLEKLKAKKASNKNPDDPNVIDLPKKRQNQMKPKHVRVNDDRYLDSLWFAPIRKIGDAIKSTKLQPIMELTGTAKGDRKNGGNSTKNENTVVTDTTTTTTAIVVDQTVTEPCEKPKMVSCRSMRATIDHIRTVHRESAALDSLDVLRKEDLEPITSEYPRRDHITNNFQSALKDTFIYNLACNNNDKMLHYLLAPPTNIKKRPSKKTYRISSSVSASPINMDLSNKYEMVPLVKFRQFSRQPRNKQEADKLLRPHLFDPATNHHRTYVVMPVGVIYDHKFETKPRHVNQRDYLMVPKTMPKTHPSKQTRAKFPVTRQSEPTRKNLGVTKYKKTPAEKLVSFIIKQDGNGTPATATTDNLAASKATTVPKQDASVIFPLHPLNVFKNKKLLEKDIQRVVQAIEEKIVNILSDPIKHNPEAFNNVEKEILDILDMMRRLKQDADETEKSKSAATATLFEIPENVILRPHSAESFVTVDDGTSELLNEVSRNADEDTETVNCLERKKSSSRRELVDVEQTERIHQKETTVEAEKFCDEIIKQIEETTQELKQLEAEERFMDFERCFETEIELSREQKPRNSAITTKEKSGEVINVRSGDFLTPYFQALKDFRKNTDSPKHTNILDFLDQLSTMAEKGNATTVHRKCVLRQTRNLKQAKVFFQTQQWYPVAYQFPLDEIGYLAKYTERSCATSRKSVICRSVQTLKPSPYENLKKKESSESYSPSSNEMKSEDSSSICLLLDKSYKFEQLHRQSDEEKANSSKSHSTDNKNTNKTSYLTIDSYLQGNDSSNENLTNAKNETSEIFEECLGNMLVTQRDECTETERIGDVRCEAITKRERVRKNKRKNPPQEYVIVEGTDLSEGDCEKHGTVLNTVYGLVFSLMYMSLTMNFSCS